nr:hypothetical protein [Desulfuromonas acetoxidans]
MQSSVVQLEGWKNLFCGYYDHSPFNPADETLLLVHANNQPAWRQPSPKTPTEILLINWRDKRLIRSLGTTYSWNWQQGARGMWLDCDSVIYNIYDASSNRYLAKVVDSEGRDRALLPIPIQEYDGKSKIFSINYDALRSIRPDYGYRNRYLSKNEFYDNGITSYDIETGKFDVIIDIYELQNDAMMRHNGKIFGVKINHVMSSPDAAFLIFLFRYHVNSRRVTDLYLIDLKTNYWRCLVSDSGTSHCCWAGNSRVLATMNGSKGFGYYFLDIFDGGLVCKWLYSDGHPVFMSDESYITDTYPDQFGIRHLLAVPYEDSGSRTELAAFPEPVFFQGETRCDLHPSLSHSQSFVQVDCAMGHRRSVAVLPNIVRE